MFTDYRTGRIYSTYEEYSYAMGGRSSSGYSASILGSGAYSSGLSSFISSSGSVHIAQPMSIVNEPNKVLLLL